MLAIYSIDNNLEGRYEFKIANQPYEEFSPASEFLFEIHLSEDSCINDGKIESIGSDTPLNQVYTIAPSAGPPLTVSYILPEFKTN